MSATADILPRPAAPAPVPDVGHFQGFGRFETGALGEYRFRTIKPVAYPGRTSHIHVKVKRGDRELLVTQCYVKGDPRNGGDGVLRRIADPRAREAVQVDFLPVPGDGPARWRHGSTSCWG